MSVCLMRFSVRLAEAISVMQGFERAEDADYADLVCSRMMLPSVHEDAGPCQAGGVAPFRRV